MILDVNELPDEKTWDADVCLVGAGAAGLAIAAEYLGRKDLRLVVLESGGLQDEPETQALYDGIVTGQPFEGVHTGRFRVFGGTTTRWGGQALPLTSLDFERRSWVANSGWPIGYGELGPHYESAARFLQIDTLNYDTDLFDLLGVVPPDFAKSDLVYHFARWCPHPDLGRLYQSSMRRADNIELLLHANVTNIVLDDRHERVDHIAYASLQGRRGTVRARQYVLCTGGIETPRLLLASNTQRTAGLGNEHDLVGRYFQDHTAIDAGELFPVDPDEVQRLFNIFHRRGVMYSVRFSLAQDIQFREKLLNGSGGINFDSDADDAYESLRMGYHKVRNRKFDREFWQYVLTCSRHASHLIRPVWEYFVRGRNYRPAARFRIGIALEQEPLRDSRVLLSNQRDALGMPRCEIHWRMSDLTLRTAQVFSRVIRDQFARAGLGEMRLEGWLANPGADWRLRFRDQYHHVGTCRMSDSAKTGVVNRDCRVHSIPNLYIAGSAVFPTSGHANSTLTIIALAKRLAARLLRDAG